MEQKELKMLKRLRRKEQTNKRRKKEFNNADNEWKCCNLFKKIITRNEYINFDSIISYDFIANEEKPVITFDKTVKKDCKYTDEKEEEGKLIINLFKNWEWF